MLRKVCVHEMINNLDSVYSLRRTELRLTVNYLYDKAGSPVNVGEHLFLTVLNMITRMMWGGTVKVEERAALAAEFRHVVDEMTTLLGTPNVSDFFPALKRFDIQGLARKMKGLRDIFDGIFDAIIQQRLNAKVGNNGVRDEESKDFLQYLLQLVDDKDAKTPFTTIHLKAMLMVCIYISPRSRSLTHHINTYVS